MHSPLTDSPLTITPLYTLLSASLKLPPEYHEELTNHLPMALHALHCLGASGEQMQTFYADYARRFGSDLIAEQMPAMDRLPTDWRALRGQANAYPEILAYFNDHVARRGVHATLRMALPALMPGLAAAAFHGVIRTAHAVQSGHTPEVAAALAYWAWRWQALRVPSDGAPTRTFEDWAACLVEMSVGWRSSGPLISIRMGDASHTRVYEALAGALPPTVSMALRIKELAGLAVDRYVASPNFTILHMVTGLHALRTLLPWLTDSAALQTSLVHNVVAAYLAAHVVPLPEPATMSPRSWTDVTEAAIASSDDHVIKLVHACREETAAYGGSQYLLAATLATARHQKK